MSPCQPGKAAPATGDPPGDTGDPQSCGSSAVPSSEGTAQKGTPRCSPDPSATSQCSERWGHSWDWRGQVALRPHGHTLPGVPVCPQVSPQSPALSLGVPTRPCSLLGSPLTPRVPTCPGVPAHPWVPTYFGIPFYNRVPAPRSLCHPRVPTCHRVPTNPCGPRPPQGAGSSPVPFGPRVPKNP